ncbi:methyltransferase domain-containing protein [Lentzea kentuckyensis]|uniref:methyltransferase domain-containing protein n=1 Tax=Lentzea kentuckyensis TaxID=360086 RepID=UPI000A36A1B5|nr:methyltransferase domain-containing protein [Lentzea kentuckyensis]
MCPDSRCAAASCYPFGNSTPDAGARLALLEDLYDPATRRHLDGLGVGPGWRCLEVGVGHGSIAGYLSDRVGPAGYVLATDIDTSVFAAPPAPNLELRTHDIGADTLPEAAFDLVHARAVLGFAPLTALRPMIAALKPGGWLLLEQMSSAPTECLEPADDEAAVLAHQMRRAINALIVRRGGDPGLGLRVPQLVRGAGLSDLGGESFAVPLRTRPVARFTLATVDLVKDQIVTAGLMTAADVDRYRACLAEPDQLFPASLWMVSVWGRRPR